MTDYLVYDVFTKDVFGGNQLAIIPDATGLAEKHLQKIAAEFNFSETTFVYPAENSNHTAKVRIFDPKNELPFAGHPTIGTAVALSDLGGHDKMILELGVGPIPCKVQKGVPSSAAFTSTIPLERFGIIPVDMIAACLSLPSTAIVTETHMPEMASVGLPFAMIELDSLESLAKATVKTDVYANANASHGTNIDTFATYAYVKTDTGFQARMFAPLSNIPEDPATGSAAAALGTYLTALSGKALNTTIMQGVEMGRPSAINISTTIESGVPTSVTVQGYAVKVMQGQLAF
ncbi:PhzF family phenazine biosynthesis protein [Amylibacter sp. SFDW26]|uniref:PhzF family phenazine biosynthesis protein n=1 Tax=Amylibacter sp. SFDW26 TaxID=2652722 RepID=UPI001261E76B|nr:PhzF family phenazine biosynthesis protein [Amylibacter sp. SFDW26]KAB7616345.1 PhzF family phenazine biosynthesis protein [Amylibacter sp. SFDW26]